MLCVASINFRTLSYLYDILEKKKKQLSESQSSLSEDDTDTKSHTDSHMTPSPDPLGGRVSENSMDGQLKRESGRVGGEVKVHISYMEIYQDTGYDLLNPGARPGSLMLTLPKVQYNAVTEHDEIECMTFCRTYLFT